MKTIIAGSRDINSLDIVYKAITESKIKISEIVSGCARGIDQKGEDIAFIHNIPLSRFPADWNQYGRSAGMIRNKQMADYADALIAIWDGKSKGTKGMLILRSVRG